jgi:DNA-binding SARP family transcriptional activator/tetratricopeptide (TPR) repeat protein
MWVVPLFGGVGLSGVRLAGVGVVAGDAVHMVTEFRLLGPVEVRAGGRVVDIGSGRPQGVLAVLLFDVNRLVSVDQIVERVWGNGRLPERPRSAVHTYISLLKRALAEVTGASFIVRHKHGYMIELDDGLLDVHRFRSLVARARGAGDDGVALFGQAFALWRGEALAVLDTPWADGARRALDAERVAAESDLMDLQLGLGQHALLLAVLAQRSTERPLDERLAVQLMLALLRSGRQAEALGVYQRVRARLAEELGADPGLGLQGLHRRILAGDPSLLLAPASAAASAMSVEVTEAEASSQCVTQGPVSVSTGVSVPRLLPAVPRWLIGRQEELDALLRPVGPRDAMDGVAAVSVVAIDGMAGVGKTALAVWAAHRLAERFPDGQLFIDLHGHTEGYAPRTCGEVLDWFLRVLGVAPGLIPRDVEERAALYRQRLCGTRTLIVLDNAATEAQIRPLLPADAGCLVVVTSRRRLKGLDESFPLPLGVLPPSDALALLRAMIGETCVGAGELVLAQIAELCGRLPLALRIAAALVRHRPGWSVGQLAGLLRDQRTRVGVLADGDRVLGAVFDLSYRTLPEAHRLLFRRLGLVPGPEVDAYAAAALADSDAGAAAGLMEDLVDHNLLIPRAPGRYRMHDLIRLHARDLAAGDLTADREAAVGRLLDFYRHTAGRAEDLVARFPGPGSAGCGPAHVPALADTDAAWAWLRAERPNLLAGMEYATAHGMPEQVVGLTAGAGSLLYVDGSWTQAIALYTAAIDVAGRLGDRSSQAHIMTLRADVLAATGDYPGALVDLQHALGLSRDLGQRGGQAGTLTRLGQVRALTGDHAGALRDLHEALELSRGRGEWLIHVNTLIILGQVRGMAGDLGGARGDLARALVLSRGLGDRRGQADALTRLGTMRQRTGDYDRAVEDLREALQLFRGLGDRRGQAIALEYLGEVRGLIGEPAAAVGDLGEALALFRHLGERFGQANTLTLLGRLRGLTGDHAGALRDLHEALELFRQTGAEVNMAWALNCYAAEIAATGDTAQALVLHHQALTAARETAQPEDEAASFEGLGVCHAHLGDTETGATHLKQALEIFRHLSMTPDADRVQTSLDNLTAGT